MPAIPTTPARNRQWLVGPIAADEVMGWGGELEAVDAIYTAYMACNAAGVRGYQESALAYQDGPTAPMELLARAGRAALARVPGVGDAGARKIWAEMVDNGDDARWNYDLWVKGQI